MKPNKIWKIAAILVALGAIFILVFMWKTSDGRIYPSISPIRPAVIAHGGAGKLAPENTLSAIRKSIDLGVDFVEVDVQMTRDGVLVLMHDVDISRTTNGSGNVHKKTLAELKELDAGAWFDEQYAAEPIPTLAEALNLLAPTKVGVVIEVKNYAAMPGVEAQIVELAEKLGMAQRTKVLSSDPGLLHQISALNSQIETIYGDADPTERVEQASTTASTSRRTSETVDAVKLTWRSIRLYVQVIDQLHQAGKQVVASPASSEADLLWLIEQGVDGILTDDPVLLLELLESG